MQEQYLWALKFHSKPLKVAWILTSNNFSIFCCVNETWNGSFLYTVYIYIYIHAIYITSVIFLCTVGRKTPIAAQNNITILTTVYSLCSSVTLAADTPSCWFTFLSMGGILLENGIPLAS
jgi:hypothetical protein